MKTKPVYITKLCIWVEVLVVTESLTAVAERPVFVLFVAGTVVFPARVVFTAVDPGIDGAVATVAVTPLSR